MTDQIRELTMDDYEQICKVLDSRDTYLGKKMPAAWLEGLKGKFFKDHIGRSDCYIVGYLKDDDLMAMAVFRRPNPRLLVIGGTWTLATVKQPRWGRTKFPRYTLEIQNYVVEACEAAGVTAVLASRPLKRRGKNVKGMVLSDKHKWNQTEVEVIPAGQPSSSEFIQAWVLCGGIFPDDLVVYSYEKTFAPPLDAPEPADFMPHDRPLRGDTPVDSAPPRNMRPNEN